MLPHLEHANHGGYGSHRDEDAGLSGGAVFVVADARPFQALRGRNGLGTAWELVCCSHYCKCSQRVGFDLGGCQARAFHKQSNERNRAMNCWGRFSRCARQHTETAFLLLPVLCCVPSSGAPGTAGWGAAWRRWVAFESSLSLGQRALFSLQLRQSVAALPACWDLYVIPSGGFLAFFF